MNIPIIFTNIKISCIGTPDNYAEIDIGDYVVLGNNIQFHCGNRIKIGKYSGISWNTTFLGSDYHSSGAKGRGVGEIILEDRVWIGCKCLILKGITIGEGAIVGAGSVVTKDVPPRTLVAGNPARIKKENIAPWR